MTTHCIANEARRSFASLSAVLQLPTQLTSAAGNHSTRNQVFKQATDKGDQLKATKEHNCTCISNRSCAEHARGQTSSMVQQLPIYIVTVLKASAQQRPDDSYDSSRWPKVDHTTNFTHCTSRFPHCTSQFAFQPPQCFSNSSLTCMRDGRCLYQPHLRQFTQPRAIWAFRDPARAAYCTGVLPLACICQCSKGSGNSNSTRCWLPS